ncbi:MAG: PEP-utilizing enzyme [Solirubrobacterales bacterium]
MARLGLPVPPFREVQRSGDSVSHTVEAVVAAAKGLLHPGHGVSVRSCSSDEDREESAAAGRYLSYNGLVSKAGIAAAAEAIVIHHESEAPTGASLSLLVQETIPSYFSGVLHLDAAGSSGTAIVEAHYGSCRTVTDGLSRPYRSFHLDGSWRHERRDAGAGADLYFAHASTFGRFRNHPGERLRSGLPGGPRDVRLFQRASSLELVVYGCPPDSPPSWHPEVCAFLLQAAEDLAGESGIDLEWTVTANGDPWLLQARPLTREISTLVQARDETTSPLGSGRPKGFPASPGAAAGVVRSPGGIRSGERTILLLRDGTIHDPRQITMSAGVIVVRGGMLCHVAIICREQGVPCIVGVGDPPSVGEAVEIDGSTGWLAQL